MPVYRVQPSERKSKTEAAQSPAGKKQNRFLDEIKSARKQVIHFNFYKLRTRVQGTSIRCGTSWCHIHLLSKLAVHKFMVE